jgi:phosphatidylglycerol:prolipoprotein diacylglycerol transferase
MIIHPNINPIIISFGPLAISWYSLSYVSGLLIGWYMIIKIATRFDLNIRKEQLDDFLTWAILGVILGGRLGYVILYDPIKYFSDPILIIKTYEGGMSFHGGIFGFVLATYLYAKKNKIKFLTLLDSSAIVAPIGLFLGRIANFINAELYGNITDVPWAVIFPRSDYMPRHPSQLYEALLEGLLLFIIMNYLCFRKKMIYSTGKLSAMFLICYTIFRSFVEFFRVPDIQIGYLTFGLTMGQILCIPMLIIGIWLLMKRNKNKS